MNSTLREPIKPTIRFTLLAAAIVTAAALTFGLAPAARPALLYALTILLVIGIVVSVAGAALENLRHLTTQDHRRARLMVDNAPLLMWVTDDQGGCTWVNRRWTQATGRSAAEASGIGWLESVHPDDRDAYQAAFDEARSSGRPLEIEYRLRQANGEYRWVMHRAEPLRGAATEAFSGYVGSVLDIHDRHEAVRERERLLMRERVARSEAEHANQVRDEFLNIVSHELRAPLNAILGWTFLLHEQLDDPDEARKAIEIIERNARAQVRMVDDLLDMNRLMAGRLQLERTLVDLSATARGAADAIMPQIAKRGQNLALEVPGTPVLVFGDAARLQQVVLKLLANATKFTPHGGEIGLAVALAGEWASVVVSDTGAGIAPEFLPHVFDRFRQAEASRARRHGGLGLGLALVNGIVQQHEGTVVASSAGLGQGAVFTVRLPVAGDSDVPGASEPASATSSAAARPLEAIRMLVVDDDPDTCELLRRVLEEFGARVRTSMSVQEALAQWTAEPPDILISDISMPERDGYSLVREIRRLPPGRGGLVPAIALTAFGRLEDQRAAQAAGFQRHIRKPVEPYELITAVSELTHRA